MKQKLLITMGDSNTEGVGCWGGPGDLGDISAENYAIHIPRFHNLGWPAILQTKIKYDYLINLGQGGTSDSHQLKSFIENITEDELKQYDVLVIWLMTLPARFSFYRNRKVCSVSAANTANRMFPDVDRLGISYLNFIGDITEDSALEQLYHIRVFDKICKYYNIPFLFSSISGSQYEFLMRIAPNEFNVINNLDIYGGTIYPNFNVHPELRSSRCHHPNEAGYEFIATTFYNIIQKQFSALINESFNGEYKKEWRGVKQW